jgi:hypothetical protein
MRLPLTIFERIPDPSKITNSASYDQHAFPDQSITDRSVKQLLRVTPNIHITPGRTEVNQSQNYFISILAPTNAPPFFNTTHNG